jgi:hypothetical protein
MNKLQHPFAPHLNKMHKLKKWSNMDGRGGERIRPNWCAGMHIWIICNIRTVLTIWNWNELRNIANLFMWLSRLWLWIPKNSGYRILHAFIQAVSHRPHLAQRQHHQTTLGQHRCTTVFHGSKSLLKTCFDACKTMGMLNMMMHLILNTNKRLQLKLDMPKLQTIKRKGSWSYVNYSSTLENSQFDSKCTQFYHKKIWHNCKRCNKTYPWMAGDLSMLSCGSSGRIPWPLHHKGCIPNQMSLQGFLEAAIEWPGSSCGRGGARRLHD